MSNAERAYIGLCVFYALVVAYWAFLGRDAVLVVINALLLVMAVAAVFFHRRQRQRRD